MQTYTRPLKAVAICENPEFATDHGIAGIERIYPTAGHADCYFRDDVMQFAEITRDEMLANFSFFYETDLDKVSY